MIPFQIFACEMILNDHTKEEVRALEFWRKGFTFRLSFCLEISRICEIAVRIFDFSSYRYQKLSLQEYQIQMEESTEFYQVYRIDIADDVFCQAAETMIRDYMDYIELKIENPEQLSRILASYPANLDEQYPKNYREAKCGWLQKNGKNHFSQSAVLPGLDAIELAVELCEPALWERFYRCGWKEFWHWYQQENQIAETFTDGRLPEGIYIGSFCCGRLFPEEDLLHNLLQKAWQEELQVTLALAPMREEEIPKYQKLLEQIKAYAAAGKKVELEINDWGLLELARQNQIDTDTLILGRLLCKKRKDVRMAYKKGCEEQLELLRETACNAEFYREHLKKEYGICRFALETGGYLSKLPPGTSLHLPFYQMNTSSYCALYAACQNGGRSHQEIPPEGCSQICRDYCFLYPEHLGMIGRFNTLYGLDRSILSDVSYFAEYLEQKPERIVLNYI